MGVDIDQGGVKAGPGDQFRLSCFGHFLTGVVACGINFTALRVHGVSGPSATVCQLGTDVSEDGVLFIAFISFLSNALLVLEIAGLEACT